MTTFSEAREAETTARQQRSENAKILMVDDTHASPSDLTLASKVQVAALAGGTEWDRALADPAVNSLFVRGVLLFERPSK